MCKSNCYSHTIIIHFVINKLIRTLDTSTAKLIQYSNNKLQIPLSFFQMKECLSIISFKAYRTCKQLCFSDFTSVCPSIAKFLRSPWSVHVSMTTFVVWCIAVFYCVNMSKGLINAVLDEAKPSYV